MWKHFVSKLHQDFTGFQNTDPEYKILDSKYSTNYVDIFLHVLLLYSGEQHFSIGVSKLFNRPIVHVEDVPGIHLTLFDGAAQCHLREPIFIGTTWNPEFGHAVALLKYTE